MSTLSTTNLKNQNSPINNLVLGSNGSVLFGSGGTAAEPSIAFNSDTDTGLYSPGANQLALATGGSGRLFITSAGLIGIGTSSPTAKLQVVGNSGSGYFNFKPADNSSSYGGFLDANGSTIGLLGGGNGGALTAGASTDFVMRAEASLLLASGGNNERLRITSGGLVGIGTSSPSALLSLAGSSAYVLQNSGRAVEGIDITATAGGSGLFGGALSFGVGGTGRAAIAAIQGTVDSDVVGLGFFGHASGTAAADAVERMRIDGSTGNVGIGTTSPGALLHSWTQSAGSATIAAALQNSSLTANTEVRLAFSPNPNVISDGRYAWIGAINKSGSTDVELTFATAPGGASGQERLRITSAGNVGIGTSAPATKLCVTGTQVIDPNLSATLGPLFSNNSTNNVDTVGLQTVFTIGRDGKQGVSYGNYVNFNIGRYSQVTTASQTRLTLQLSNGNQNNPDVDVLTLLGSGNVGIGTTSPGSVLDVRFTTNPSNDNGTGLNVIRSGTLAAQGAGLGGGIALGGSATNNGLDFVSFGQIAGRKANSTAGNYAGYLEFITNNDVGTMVECLRLDSANAYFPGIGTTASAANAFLNSGSTPANQLLRSTSSLRYKTSIEDLEDARADAILDLRPVWYRSLADADRKDWSWYGLIAEEVAEVEPRLVHWTYLEDAYEEVDGERQLKPDAEQVPDGVQYDRLTVLLLDLVQRQNERIEALEAKVAALEGA